jgi:hypothetical protein
MLYRKPELLGRDEAGGGKRPCPDVLNPRQNEGVPSGVNSDVRMRRRAARTPPDLSRTTHSPKETVWLRLTKGVACIPASQGGRLLIAGKQPLSRVRQTTRLVALGMVLPTQLEGIEIERVRELVDRLLEGRDPLHHAWCAEGILRATVRLRREANDTYVLACVKVERRCENDRNKERCVTLALIDDRLDLDRGECPVASCSKTDRLLCPRSPPAVELLGMAVVHGAHRPVSLTSELGGRDRLEAGALFRSERAADVLRDHADLIRRESKQFGQLATCVEHALGREPDRERVALPARHRGMRLERRLQVIRRLELELDR